MLPRCVDRSLGGSAANWHHPPNPHVGHRKNLPTSEGSSMTHFTRVALCNTLKFACFKLGESDLFMLLCVHENLEQ
jgi:hypothetical protein